MKPYYFYSFLAALLFGASVPLSKLLLVSLNPVFLAGVYYLGAALFLIPFSTKEFRRELHHLKKNKKDFLRLLGAIFFGGILGPILLLFGIERMNAVGASLLLNTESIATFLFAWLFFKEHITRRVFFATLLVVGAGVLLVLKDDLSFNWGGLLIVLACFAWGLDNNLTATIEGITARTSTALKGIVAGIFNCSLAFIFFEINIPFGSLILALLVGAFAYGLSIVLYIYSARTIGALRSQLVFSLNPFLGSLLAYVIFFEPLNLKFFIALSLMILAVCFLNHESHKHEHIHPEIEHEHEHNHVDGHHNHQHTGLKPKTKHIHNHTHKKIIHIHDHFPDVHHRHKH